MIKSKSKLVKCVSPTILLQEEMWLFLLWLSGLEWRQRPGPSEGGGAGGNRNRSRLLHRKSRGLWARAELAQVIELLLIPGLDPKGVCRLWGALWILLWVGCRHCHLHVLREWHDLTYVLGEKYFLAEQFFKNRKIEVKMSDKFGSQTWVCHYMNYHSLGTFTYHKWSVYLLISLLKVGLIVIDLSRTSRSLRVCLVEAGVVVHHGFSSACKSHKNPGSEQRDGCYLTHISSQTVTVLMSWTPNAAQRVMSWRAGANRSHYGSASQDRGEQIFDNVH